QRALEVHADSRARRSGLLGHGMQPVLLAATAHDDQVAARRLKDRAPAAVARAQEEAARRAQAEHGHDALVSFARGPIAVPARAVALVAIEVEPQSVVGNPIV